VVLIYEFWKYDIPTEIVEGFLEEMKIPYKERSLKRKRESLYGQPYDDWVRIYVDAKDMIKWLSKEIEDRLKSFV
jgi:hypothetical protein